MNRERFERLWDECRDGQLSDADRSAFEAHLLVSDADRALWDAESKWLASMRDTAAFKSDEPVVMGDAAFASAVLDRWENDGVVGRIGFARFRWAIGIAAMIAIVVGGGLYLKSLQVQTVTPPPVVVNDGLPDGSQTVDPVTALMSGAQQTFSFAAAQPDRIRQTLTDSTQYLDVNNLATLLVPAVPDPADYVEPTPETKS